MDEYNDNANDEARTLVKATSGGERSLNGHARREETSLAPHPSARPGKEALSTRNNSFKNLLALRKSCDRLAQFASPTFLILGIS